MKASENRQRTSQTSASHQAESRVGDVSAAAPSSAVRLAQMQKASGNRAMTAWLRSGGAGNATSTAAPAQRQAVVQRFADIEEAEHWYEAKKEECTANSERAERLKEYMDEFEDALQAWRDFDNEACAERTRDAQKALNKYLPIATGVELWETQINTLKTRALQEKGGIDKLAKAFLPGSWLRDYATTVQKERMDVLRTPMTPAVTARNSFMEKLDKMLTVLQKPEFVKKYVPSMREKIINAINEAKPEKFNEEAKTEAEEIYKKLEEQAELYMKEQINTARGDDRMLDVPGGEVDAAAKGMFDRQLNKELVRKVIGDALELQYKLPRELWLTRVLLLSAANGGAYMRDIANIDGKSTHVTRYANSMPEKPEVTTGAGTLKNQVLGTGVTAFHVTIETGAPVYQKPHAYRGDPILDNWASYPRVGTAFESRADLREALTNVRNAQVNAAENRIDGVIANKGKNLQTSKIVNYIKL